jgi:glycosyltransferase involved in cell wall biosynthesis
MTPSPFFSVLVPTRNRVDMLERAISSVMAQTFQDFELIVVDDGSGDDTQRYLNQLDDARIRVLRHEAAKGAAAARNAGIKIASGKYISFLDDDDECLPPFLERALGVLESAPPEVGFCWSGIMNVRDNVSGETEISAAIWDPETHEREDRERTFLLRRRIGICGLTVRRSCFEHIGLFDEALRAAEDTDFLIRLSRKYDYTVVREVLVKVHLHERGNLTVYGPGMAAAYARILEKNMEVLRGDQNAYRDMHYKAGWLHYHAGDRATGRSYLLKALKRSPYHIKTWAMLVLLECTGKTGHHFHKLISRMLGHAR